MTMKVTEHTITSKRKHHPNDKRYPCRASQEVLNASMKLMNILSSDELKLLLDNELILDEEETEELYDEIKINDIIGLAIVRKDGIRSNKYEVVDIKENEDYMICKNLLSEECEEISFQDISIGFALGFAEILYRDEKPYGVSEEIEYNIAIHHDTPSEDETSADSTAKPLNDNHDQSTAVVDNESLDPEINLQWSDMYFKFENGSDPTGPEGCYVIITPKKLWDEEGYICDQSSATDLALNIGLDELMESTYEYLATYTEKQLRDKLINLGAVENLNL